jgi:hypothetical protein
MDPLPRPPIVVIVRHGEERLYHHLRLAFADSLAVEVLLDRRAGDRRRRQQAPRGERRRGDRRWPSPSPSEQEVWKLAGFRVLLRPGDVEVYESGIGEMDA